MLTPSQTKAQLAIKRCKQFELGYVNSTTPCPLPGPVSIGTNNLPVATRRPRAPPSCSKRVVSTLSNFLFNVVFLYYYGI